jgi:Flp pilus assembly protein TadG
MRAWRILRSVWQQEFGQGLVLGALAMVVILGFAAMAVDVGLFLHERRDLQKSADAAALAGVQELPGAPAEAEAKVHEWADKNGIDIAGGELEAVEVGTTYAENDTVTVRVQRDVPFVFARVLGFSSDTMRADATARVGSPSWADNVMPWALTKSSQEAATYGNEVILKYSADDTAVSGNFNAMALMGATGAADYRQAIIDGVETCVGCTESTEPGNMTGPTEAGLEDRLGGTSDDCDTFLEVFEPVDGGDTWQFVDDDCNPWEEEGEGSGRVVLIPVIDDLDAGRDEVIVIRFALVFLSNEADDNICPTGLGCDVEAIFVRTYDDIGALIGPYNPGSDIHFARLVE